MATKYPFLLFINEDGFSGKKSQNPDSPKGYALFCPAEDNIMKPCIEKFLTKSGLHLVSEQPLEPSNNVKFQAVEILVYSYSLGVRFVRCAASNSKLVSRLFCWSDIKVHDDITDDQIVIDLDSELIEKQKETVVNLLLGHGADPNASDSKGTTPLMRAYRSPTVLRFLVAKGAVVDAETTDGRTVLLKAVKHKCFISAEYILSLQPNPNVTGNRKAFYVAVGGFHEEYDSLVEKMLNRGFTIGPDVVKKPDIIFGAVAKGLVDTVGELLDAGVPANQMQKRFSAPLQTAIENNQQDKVRALVSAGGTANQLWRTPLHLAIEDNQEDMVRLLLERGADVNITRDTDFQSPLLTVFSSENKNIEIVRMLFKAEEEDRLNPMFLFSAMKDLRLDLFSFLLEEGQDPNAVNKDNNSCFTVLSSRHTREYIDILAKFGARCRYIDLKNTQWTNEMLQVFLDYCPVDASASDLSVKNDVTARHLVKLQALIPGINIASTVFSRYHLGTFKEDCMGEALRLSEHVGDTNIKYRDVMTSDIHRVACYARNDGINEAMIPEEIERNFPIYSSVLNCRFRMGVWRKSLIDNAVPVLRYLFNQFRSVPDDILEAITRLLSNRDLFVLFKCLPVKKPVESLPC